MRRRRGMLRAPSRSRLWFRTIGRSRPFRHSAVSPSDFGAAAWPFAWALAHGRQFPDPILGLVVDIPPLAHSDEAQEARAAGFAELAGGEVGAFVLVPAPEVQVGDE